MLKIAICDDEKIFLEMANNTISNILSAQKIDFKINLFNNGNKLISYCNDEILDIIFIDIAMPQIDGFKTAHLLKKNNAKLVFLTQFYDSATEGYKYGAFRYIIKEKMNEELKECFESFFIQKNSRIIEFKVKKLDSIETVGIRESDIIYIESNLRKAEIETNTEKYQLLTCKLKDIKSKLSDEDFIIVHRSYIVNLNYIKSFEKNTIIFSNNTKIPIGRNSETEIKKKYFEFLRRKL